MFGVTKNCITHNLYMFTIKSDKNTSYDITYKQVFDSIIT